MCNCDIYFGLAIETKYGKRKQVVILKMVQTLLHFSMMLWSDAIHFKVLKSFFFRIKILPKIIVYLTTQIAVQILNQVL